jgi:hypothetical protein
MVEIHISNLIILKLHGNIPNYPLLNQILLISIQKFLNLVLFLLY